MHCASSKSTAACGQVRRIQSSLPARNGMSKSPFVAVPRTDEFDRFEFVSDYEVKGLQNLYHTFGLGVPLIAVRKSGAVSQPAEGYFPPVVSFPMTAFLRLLPDAPQVDGAVAPHRAVLELYDPLTSHDIVVADRRIPLETDLSTPLAYMLNDPALQKSTRQQAVCCGPQKRRR